MDNGAHFYKCDFQIHTPRDNNWTGNKPISDEERLAFARSFIAKCRDIGLKAVAITDHHDVCFIKYIQVASQENNHTSNDLDLGSLVVNPLQQNPIVFPGIEITLSMPCQCILLLDADSDTTIQSELLEAIGIGNSHSDSFKNGPVVNPINLSIIELHNKINEYAHGRLKGKYIILPHVGDGGHKTILRQGFNVHYAKMPCLGGYIEQDWEAHRSRHIFEGKDHNYGNKSLGIFQTTDSRREDFRELGKRSTWIKFSTPTIEAIRQACLAKESRISQVKPSLPNVYIERIEVSDSEFLGPVDFYFNPQYNAIIGGRGTGKTTILEYIRYAMQDQCIISDGNLQDEMLRKRENIQKTANSHNAKVTICWKKNNVSHKVLLDTKEREIKLSIGDKAFGVIEPEQLRQILPIQAYSQKQLSIVGTRISELRRIIEAPFRTELDECNRIVSEEKSKIQDLYTKLCKLNQKEKQLKSLRTQKDSLESQIEALEKSLTAIPSDLQKALKENPQRLQENQAVESIDTDIKQVTNDLNKIIESLDKLPINVDVDKDSPQKELVSVMVQEVTDIISRIKDGVVTAKATCIDNQMSLFEDMAKWEDNHREHIKNYIKAQENSKENREKVEKISEFQKDVAGIKQAIGSLENELKESQKTTEEFDKLFEAWVSKHSERADILEKACKELTEKSGNDIEASLQRGADIEGPVAQLKEKLSGCRIDQGRWERLSDFLKKHPDSPAKAWKILMTQLRPLAEFEETDVTPGTQFPQVNCLDLTKNMQIGIVQRLSPMMWLELALTSLKDKPVFKYCPSPSKKIPFENASAGQQATALLKVLLKENAGPLIIDQPEDDLDNSVVLEIAKTIWEAKNKRQLIFSSHNANLVVNGDAELVIHCDYEDEHDKTKGVIKTQGAIDNKDVKETIKKVMEGGEKAFKLRFQKYGF